LSMRIGFGYDAHKLVRGRKLVLAGQEIPHARGLLGWSDADVLLHAVIDALIGAAGEGDIGRHFPPGDERYKDISSLRLLEMTRDLLTRNGYRVGNVDATVVAEEPRIAPYIDAMRKNIAERLGIPAQAVNLKGKTEEGMGFTGKKEGIAAYAVCLLEKV